MDDPLDLDNVPECTSQASMATYRLARIVRSGLSDVLSSYSELGLVAWRISLCLSEEVIVSQKVLVNFTDIEQAQVSRALGIMETRGLINSFKSPDDGRVRLFSLTDMGTRHFERVLPAVTAYYDGLDKALSEDERAQFLDMARRMALATKTALKAAENQQLAELALPEALTKRT